MQNKWIWFGLALSLLVGLGGIGADAVSLRQEMPPYRFGSWEIDGRGQHRAVVHVAEPASAVAVSVPWRRRDPFPDSKKIVVYAPGDREEITRVRPLEINAARGEVVFAAPEAGDYYLYYLPFIQGKNWSDEPGEYFKPEYPAWDFGDPSRLPRAEVIPPFRPKA